jgi:crotonobetainyl-CoA:carnitine CoA-transferase CaiB-like acyl-CoA transferase
MTTGMFEGVRVLELAQYVFVPGAGMLLADQGAEVIHVETPDGDPYRSLQIGDGREIASINLAMEQNNHSKKSIALDLKSKDGHAAFLELVKTADVFITSLRPKAIKSLRLDVEDLRKVNPKIIYARGNGVGFRGEESDKAGFDASAFWARGGMAYVMTRPGQPLTPPRAALGDHSGSVGMAFGIASALFKRATTGEPSVVEVSLLSTALWMLSSDITYAQDPNYVVHHANPNRFPLMSAYPSRDGRMVQFMLLNPQPFWPGLCQLIDRTDIVDDPRFADNASRLRNADALVEIIATAIAQRDWAEWKPLLEAWDAPWELIRSVTDTHEDPQVIANDMIRTLEVEGQPIKIVSGPVTFDGSTHAVLPRSSPSLGEHTEELLASAGYSAQDIAALKASRAAV